LTNSEQRLYSLQVADNSGNHLRKVCISQPRSPLVR